VGHRPRRGLVWKSTRPKGGERNWGKWPPEKREKPGKIKEGHGQGRDRRKVGGDGGGGPAPHIKTVSVLLSKEDELNQGSKYPRGGKKRE